MATKSSTKSKSTLQGTASADVLTVKHDQVTVTAAGGNDTITVSAGKSHVIHGNTGNDTITIGKSAGTGIKVYGDAGNDIIKATNSYGVIFYGGDGSDTLTGGSGADKLYGDAGADKLYGGAGNDTLSGGAGDDLLNGQAGTDTLTGGAGKDTFVYESGGGSDKITDYSAGYDTLYISSGSISKTTLANSSKDLVFTVGSGKVTLSNAAAKTISLKDSRGNYTASKTAITLGSNFTGTMDAAKYLGTVTTVNGKTTTKAVTVKGNAKANTIYGGSGANTIYGYAGNDKLYGYGGNDKLYGGASEDMLYGGDGDDTLSGGSGDDTLTGGAGNDTFVYSSGNDRIKDYTEAKDTLQINKDYEITKVVVDEDVDLFLSTQETSTTSAAGDITLEGAEGKKVKITDFQGTYTLTADVKPGVVIGDDFGSNGFVAYGGLIDIDASSNTTGLILMGNEEDNIIWAGSGVVNGLFGAAGDDVLYGSTGTDVLYGGKGEDTLYGNDYKDYLYGNEGNDELWGQNGNDDLYGGEGDDFLCGGDANDTLYGGDGTDTYHFARSTNNKYGTDVIQDFENNEIISFADTSLYTSGAYELDGNDVLLKYGDDQGTIKIINGKGLTARFANGPVSSLKFN